MLLIRRHIRLKEFLQISGLSKSTVYLKLDKESSHYDPELPRPIKLHQSRSGAIAFVSTEVEAWMDSLIAARDQESV